MNKEERKIHKNLSLMSIQWRWDCKSFSISHHCHHDDDDDDSPT